MLSSRQPPCTSSCPAAVRPQTTTCPGDELHLLVSLNGIDPNYVLLGDIGCQPTWSNETFAQFTSHVDNCSLLLTEGSIVGKLRWEGVDKDTNEPKKYERFFLCPSDIFRIRVPDWTTTTTTTSALRETTTTTVSAGTPSTAASISSTRRHFPFVSTFNYQEGVSTADRSAH